MMGLMLFIAFEWLLLFCTAVFIQYWLLTGHWAAVLIGITGFVSAYYLAIIWWRNR